MTSYDYDKSLVLSKYIQHTTSNIMLLTFVYILNNLKNNRTKISIVIDWILEEKKKSVCMKHVILK